MSTWPTNQGFVAPYQNRQLAPGPQGPDSVWRGAFNGMLAQQKNMQAFSNPFSQGAAGMRGGQAQMQPPFPMGMLAQQNNHQMGMPTFANPLSQGGPGMRGGQGNMQPPFPMGGAHPGMLNPQMIMAQMNQQQHPGPGPRPELPPQLPAMLSGPGLPHLLPNPPSADMIQGEKRREDWQPWPDEVRGFQRQMSPELQRFREIVNQRRAQIGDGAQQNEAPTGNAYFQPPVAQGQSPYDQSRSQATPAYGAQQTGFQPGSPYSQGNAHQAQYPYGQPSFKPMPETPEAWFEQMIPPEFAHLKTEEQVVEMRDKLEQEGKLTPEAHEGLRFAMDKINWLWTQETDPAFAHLTTPDEIDAKLEELKGEGSLTKDLYRLLMNQKDKMIGEIVAGQKQPIGPIIDIKKRFAGALDENGELKQIPPPAASTAAPGRGAEALLALYEAFAALTPERQNSHFSSPNLREYFKAVMSVIVPAAEEFELSGTFPEEAIMKLVRLTDQARSIFAGEPNETKLQEALHDIESMFKHPSQLTLLMQ